MFGLPWLRATSSGQIRRSFCVTVASLCAMRRSTRLVRYSWPLPRQRCPAAPQSSPTHHLTRLSPAVPGRQGSAAASPRFVVVDRPLRDLYRGHAPGWEVMRTMAPVPTATHSGSLHDERTQLSRFSFIRGQRQLWMLVRSVVVSCRDVNYWLLA